MIFRLFLLVTIFIGTCNFIFATTFSISIPQKEVNSSGPVAGIVTNSVTDGTISSATLASLEPRMMRWPEGGTAGRILFDIQTPSVMKITIHDPTAWWVSYLNGNTSNWTFSPQLDFDEFIALCKASRATPIVLVGITSAYNKTTYPRVALQEIVKAAKDWVTYANIQKGYGIKYWEIGNEDDLEGATPKEYAEIFNQVVAAMKNVDPAIKCGANNMSGLARWNQLLPLLNPKPDFLITHSYAWTKTYEAWYPHEEHWDWDVAGKEATSAINANAGVPKELYITEISSFVPGYENDGNSTWKGLHNMQMQLEALSRPYTKGVTSWVTRWDDSGVATSFNLFTPTYELTPMGHSCLYGKHLYKNLTQKKVSSYITVWTSYSEDLTRMSLFILNRFTDNASASFSINGFKGNYAHEKWLYHGTSPTSTDARFDKVQQESIKSNSFNISLPPTSMTILNFNGAGYPIQEAQITINLTKGWNLISTPLQPSDSAIDRVLANLKGKYNAVYAYNVSGYEAYIPEESFELKSIETGRGYWIFIVEPVQLTIKGSKSTGPVNLKQGWNLVGFNSIDTMSVTSAFSSLSGKYSVVYGYDNASGKYLGYTPGVTNDLTQLQPGKGYWIYVNKPAAWTLGN
jgi:hypothetical protein